MGDIAASTPYISRGVEEIYWLPSLAATSLVPTRSEIDSTGTRLTPEVTAASGWTVDGSEVDASPLTSTFRASISGINTVADSSLTFRATKTGTDIRSVISQGDNGWILRCPGGDVTGYPGDVFPVRVKSISVPVDVSGQSVAAIVVQFAVTAEPAQNITLPATA